MTAYLLATMLFIGEREVQTEKPAPTGKPSLQVPAQVQAQPMLPFKVVAETNLRWMRWHVPAGLTRVDPKDTAYGEKAFLGFGPAGVYEFRVEGTLNDEPCEAKCVVFVGQPTPVPPGPPAPGPAPTDPFTAELQPLYTADKGTVDQRDKLCELWRSAAVQVEGNPEFKTMSDFTAKMRGVAVSFPFNLDDDVLRQIRMKLATDLTAACGPGTTELAPPKSECRKKAAAMLMKYANGLGGCK